VNSYELDHHISYCVQQFEATLNEHGKVDKTYRAIAVGALEEIFKPVVKRIQTECNERIDLYQREIELLKQDVINLKKGMAYIGEINMAEVRFTLYTDRMEH